MPQFDVATFASQIFWLVIHFTVLYWVVGRFALPRLGQVLETRQQRLDADLEQARKLNREVDHVQAELRIARTKARQEANAVLDQAKAAVTAEVEERRAAVLAEASALVGKAQTEIAGSVDAARAGLEALAGDLAGQVGRRLSDSGALKQAS